MRPLTHLGIDARLCGTPLSLETSRASVQLLTLPEMAADERGLVHGGFLFGLADHAAMLAVNEPNVVLGSAELRLLAPVVVGELLRAEAVRARIEGKKHHVDVDVWRGAERVLTAALVCFVPSVHVLDTRKAAP